MAFRTLNRFLATLRNRFTNILWQSVLVEREEPVLIDHTKIIDGFGDLVKYRHYRPFASHCGKCEAPIVVSGKTQQYLLEVKGIPAKFLMRGVVFCDACRKRRARLNWLKSGDRWRTEPDGEEELARLRETEEQSRRQSRHLYEHAPWPYHGSWRELP
jgi:hypothetical protein